MKTRCVCRSIISAMLFAAPAARGQAPESDATNSLSRAVLQPPPTEKLNQIGLSYRMGLNITVDFKKLGGFPPVSDPGPASGSTYNRGYDNGSYNPPGISNTAGGPPPFSGGRKDSHGREQIPVHGRPFCPVH